MAAFHVADVGPLVVGRSGAVSRVDLSMVLPTYNEAENITAVIEQLSAVLDAIEGLEYELIVVDDDSPDGTWEQALELKDRFSRIQVIRRQGERGLATAVVRGWQFAQGDVLGVIDADLQHPPEVATQLWREMALGADMAIGSRHVPGGGVSDWKWYRRIISRGAQAVGLALLPGVVGKVKDPMSGYFMVRRSALLQRELHPLGYKILIEVLGRTDIRAVAEVPYNFRERAEGASKATRQVYVEYLQQLVRLRLDSFKRWVRRG